VVRYATAVGRESLIAGSDCGFATFAPSPSVHPTITWATLVAMADGAALATSLLGR
jgi:5-methyltetrahydropteroyltriglutamate--homocysteine methyltransferase